MIGSRPPWNRRTVAASGAALLLGAGGFRSVMAAPHAGMAPIRCADFLDTIGVNTHITYTGSQYGATSAIVSAMNYIGARHVRDVAINSARPNAEHYLALAAAGIKFCMFWGVKRSMTNAVQEIAGLEAAYPGAVQALEGPNEIKANFTYANVTGVAAGQRFMDDMRRTASASPALRDKPLVIFTSDNPVAADCDFANDHPYPKGGAQPGKLLAATREAHVGRFSPMPGKPIMFTEFGYHTLVGKPSRPVFWQGVDPPSQAALLVNGLLDNAAANVARTYIYQLLDGFADAGPQPNQENHFGLFTREGSPKPSAMALRSLSKILADPAPHARTFAPEPVMAQIGFAQPVSSLALRNASGQTFIALWNESPIWDKESAAPLAISPYPGTVSLPRAAPTRVFDVLDPRKNVDLGSVSTVTIAVGAAPIVVRIG